LFVSNITYLALFPNFEERTPSDYRFDDPHVPDWCDPDVGSVSYTHSARNMPTEYFMFMESGPDLYAQTDKRPFIGTFSALAMGFR